MAAAFFWTRASALVSPLTLTKQGCCSMTGRAFQSSLSRLERASRWSPCPASQTTSRCSLPPAWASIYEPGTQCAMTGSTAIRGRQPKCWTNRSARATARRTPAAGNESQYDRKTGSGTRLLILIDGRRQFRELHRGAFQSRDQREQHREILDADFRNLVLAKPTRFSGSRPNRRAGCETSFPD
jgi:hypothetical protein